MRSFLSRALCLTGVLGLLTFAAQASPAQSPFSFRRQPPPPLVETNNVPYDGRFTFCRLSFTSGPGGFYWHGLPPWAHGYPRAERNLMKILNGVSNIDPRMDASNVISVGDPELFKYPLAYMTEPGFLTLTNQEAQALREYLLKGGFIIFDDFRGPNDWDNFQTVLKQVLPDGRLTELDGTHATFHSFFEIPDPLDFIPYYDRARPSFWGMFDGNDPSKRLMLIANFNNDVSEYWEWSDTGLTPIDLSNEAYKLVVDYVMYGMTH